LAVSIFVSSTRVPWQIDGMRPKFALCSFGLGVLLLGASGACSSSGGTDGSAAGGAGSSSAGSSSALAGSASGGTSPSAGTNSGGANASAGANSGGANASAGTNSGGASGGSGSSAGTNSGGASGGTAGSATDAYDAAVLADQPVAFWAMNRGSASEPDLTGKGHTGSYLGGATQIAQLPNGDSVVVFDGATQYLTVPSSAAFSIPTTGNLAWEAWLRPDVLQFPHDDGSSGYVDWMGKCENYSPTCEWEARLYDLTTKENPNRPNRFSAYVFNPSAGLGSAADWQPSAGSIAAGTWYHVVGQYTTLSQPADCMNTASAPGSIDIWVNGVKWNHASHGQTGCMSQYNVVPKANGSPLDIGTMSKESFFFGAIGKVAIYDHLLSQTQISNHYTVMTGKMPAGSCADTCSF
jgi:hypothetical protein